MTRSSSNPDLSVIVPVFNGEQFVFERVKHLVGFIKGTGCTHEIIVVDDGSTDGTLKTLYRLREEEGIKITRNAGNRGKFSAIRLGMAASEGACCLFTDADIPYDLRVIPHMMHHILDRGVHLVVGDRTVAGSVYISHLGIIRRAATTLFSFGVRTLVTGGLSDTQCGIKAIRGDVARELFPLLREDGFAGDLELLYVALKYNLEIKRVPARLVYQSPSSVRPLRDGIRMALSLWRIKRNHRRGLFKNDRLKHMGIQDYWSEGHKEEHP